MVLFREAFHCSHEGLNLSLQCGGSWQLVSLTVVGGGHRANEYHATLVSEKRLVWLNNHHFPQTTPTDEAVNLTSELHDLNARVNHLCKKEERKRPSREHQCGAGQIPSEGQVRNILTTLEC